MRPCIARRARARTVVAVACLATLAPVVAQAQRGIGARIRQAAEAAAARKASSTVATPVDPKRYDQAVIGTPFDASSLDATLRGLRAIAAQREESQALMREANALASEGAASNEQSQLRRERERIAECRYDWMQKTMYERLQQAERHVRAPSSPVSAIDAWEQARMAHDRAQLAALERADTAGAWALTRELLRKHTGSTITEAQDEATLVKTCGALPGGGAGARSDGLRTRARELERSVADAGARASGMTPARFALARERLVTYASDAASRKSGSWSPDEWRLLEGRRAEIESALRGA